MPIQEELTAALEAGRADVVRTLAEHKVRPTVIDTSDSSISDMLGGSRPDFRLDSADGSRGVVDRQTTSYVVDTLELESEDDCEAVRAEIESHDAWDSA